jgi:hypothetical protein
MGIHPNPLDATRLLWDSSQLATWNIGMKSLLLPLFLWPLFASPTEALIDTPHGPLRLYSIRLVKASRYGPCKLSASIENSTSIGWTSVVLSVVATGRSLSGDTASFKTTIALDKINAHSLKYAPGECEKSNQQPDINIEEISASMFEGTPDSKDVTTAREEERERKRNLAQATSARAARERASQERAAYLAKLPALSNGSEAVFIGANAKCSDQFVEALRMEGLEKRKRIAELIAFKCGFLVDNGTHVELLRRDGARAVVKMAEGERLGASGWVPTTWIR